MAEMMKAGVVHAREDIRYEDIKKPVPKEGEVLIRVKYTGICGSDLPRVNGDACRFFPNVLGHEFSGTVAEIGSGVTSLAVGDWVAGVPLVPCMTCADCQKGDYSLCKHYSFIGSREFGSFAEYVVVPEGNAVKFDETVSFEMGAFFEPATVALHGIRRLDYIGGKTVAVLGGGTIGMFVMQWAKIFGGEQTVVFDIADERLALGKKLGATAGINTTEKDFIDQAMALTNGRGFDYVFETAGNTATMKMVFQLAGNKAQVCFVGTPTKDLSFTVDEWEQMNRKEFLLTGSWMSYSAPFPGEEWWLTAEYFKKGLLQFDQSFIFRTLPLSRIAEAFEMFKTPGMVKGKILIDSQEGRAERCHTEAGEHPLRQILAQRKFGAHAGVISYCSASPLVIETALERAKTSGKPVLIEATANQVNQFGGYTNMKPRDFAAFVFEIAKQVGCDPSLIILGGDHLGPLTWAEEPEESAMEKSEALVDAYVRAGFTKLHLDTSMKLGDDPKDAPLATKVIAQRGARLYRAAMTAYEELKKERPDALRPVFIIGSEVPIPGGAQEEEDGIAVTKAADFLDTIEAYQQVFESCGLTDAWNDIIAIVVQPGVEFGDEQIFAYSSEEAKDLCAALANYSEICFEGHSTDYQSPQALREMVRDGIAILKVGPALTFGLREALFSLSMIEKALLEEGEQAHFIETLEEVMLENPKNWEKHYRGDAKAKAFARKYSFSDRSRYYMNDHRVEAAMERLFGNLEKRGIPLTILHEYLPIQYQKVRSGSLSPDPRTLAKDGVASFMADYEYAIKGDE